MGLVVSLFIGRGGDIIVGDAAESFEYARVLATEGHFPHALIRFPCGVPMIGAIAYLPAFATAKALVHAGLIGGERWASGWALPLQAAYCLPLLLLSVAGFAANVRMLRHLGFTDVVARPAVLFWIVTTNVGYYVFKEPAMTEAATYATVSLFYAGLVRWVYGEGDTPPWRQAVMLGLWLGLAGAVRQQNILHALSVPLLAVVAPRRPGGLAGAARFVAITAIASAALFIIPWVVWGASTGELHLMSYREGHFNWTSPRPWLVLFAPAYHGLLLFHPAILVALAGLTWLLRRHPSLRPVILIAFALQLYLLSTWYWLSFGASIGHRGFMTIMPLLLAGFAAAVERAHAAHRERPFILSMAVLAVANGVLVVLVLAHVLDPTGAGAPANSGF